MGQKADGNQGGTCLRHLFLMEIHSLHFKPKTVGSRRWDNRWEKKQEHLENNVSVGETEVLSITTLPLQRLLKAKMVKFVLKETAKSDK